MLLRACTLCCALTAKPGAVAPAYLLNVVHQIDVILQALQVAANASFNNIYLLSSGIQHRRDPKVLSLILCLGGAGFLPFSAIYIELYYIFASVWGHKVYTIYSILFIVFIILIIVTAFITIALTYFQLAVEDHSWWWRSFVCGGSTGVTQASLNCFTVFCSDCMQAADLHCCLHDNDVVVPKPCSLRHCPHKTSTILISLTAQPGVIKRTLSGSATKPDWLKSLCLDSSHSWCCRSVRIWVLPVLLYSQE